MKAGFSILSEAYYADVALHGRDYIDEVAFGLYNVEYDGSHTCSHGHSEVMIRWYILEGKAVPKMEMYYDSFGNFTALREVFAELARWTNNFSVDDLSELLRGLGFEDITSRER